MDKEEVIELDFVINKLTNSIENVITKTVFRPKCLFFKTLI